MASSISPSASRSPSSSASPSPSPAFQTAIEPFSTKVNGQVIDVTHITDLQDEIGAIETALISGPFTIGNTTLSSNTFTTPAFVVSLVAGETVAARDAVYVEPTLTPGTAGRVYKMDGDVLVKSTQAFFVGFVTTGVSAAANVAVQISGVVSGFSGLTTGAVYYASSTAGAITATKPVHPVPLGMAISATQLLVNTGIKRETDQTENVGAIYGYVMGGDSGAEVATTDRITFSTSATAASTVSNLSGIRGYGAGVSDGAV